MVLCSKRITGGEPEESREDHPVTLCSHHFLQDPLLCYTYVYTHKYTCVCIYVHAFFLFVHTFMPFIAFFYIFLIFYLFIFYVSYILDTTVVCEACTQESH